MMDRFDLPWGNIKSSSWKDFQDNCEKYKMKMMSESDLKSISKTYSNCP